RRMKNNTQQKPSRGRGKSAARRQAAAMLAAIERGKTLDEARDRLGDLSTADRAFASAMVMTALRRRGSIEATLVPHLKKPVPPRPHLASALLHIGAAQILFMDVPPHAAINETVAATGRREQPFRGLINAVLRRVSEAGPNMDAVSDLPMWLLDGWRQAYGAKQTAQIEAVLRQTPPLDLQFRNAIALQDWQAANPGMGHALTPTCLRLEATGDVTRLPGFDAGMWWVQDISAALAAPLLRADAQTHVLDLCAAPGGKTLQLAASGARVTALDASQSRLERLRANLARTGLSAQALPADLENWEAPRSFSHVLLDAPCSATGTIRRHPDLPLHRRRSDIEKSARLQSTLLERAADATTPGGTLVYCVCSLEPEEGEGVAWAFLASRDDFSLMPIEADEVPECLSMAVTGAGHVRTTPAMLAASGGCDGFFAARFHKKA
ncbi:MAG: transcription antitermination factor NusB, partial [Pseudomonadota bacterium]|nr:transcription antitermination factor NusB [Pseudomonadota bacterium]